MSAALCLELFAPGNALLNFLLIQAICVTSMHVRVTTAFPSETTLRGVG